MDTDRDDQENELLALKSIFDDESKILIINTASRQAEFCNSGSLDVSPAVSNSRIEIKFVYKREENAHMIGSSASKNSQQSDSVHFVSYLPPISLNFLLPANYPSKDPPHINLSCKWLNRKELSKLIRRLDGIWEEQQGQEILYSWYHCLTEESLNILGMIDTVEIKEDEYVKTKQSTKLDQRVVQTSESFSEILSVLLEYNEKKLCNIFNTTSFQCNVCFAEKSGCDCIQFKDCQHVYCKNCMKSYFHFQITDGNVKTLGCPELECTSLVYPAQIKELVSEDEFSLYERILLQTALDTMNDVMYCPLKHCQAPVIVEPEETIGICSVCKYSFCTYCKLSYHGVEPCRLRAAAVRTVCLQYKNADEELKRNLELKYGAKYLADTLHNLESEEWLKENSKNCPGCGAPIEKYDGCNKMTCYKCKSYFCWLCMHHLDRGNPYQHYNTFGSSCFNKLFEGVEIDYEGIENHMF